MRTLVLALPVLTLAASASAQSALLREGDASPDGTAGQTITGISNTAVNQAGGYACTLTTGGTNGTINAIWGELSGAPAGALIRQEAVIGTLTQNNLEGFFGISPSSVSYSAVSDDAGGATGLDGVWVDDTVFAIEEAPVVGTTDFYSFCSRPGITDGGVPHFIGGLTDTQGGSTQRRGLFLGTTRVYASGDVLANMPAAVSVQGPDFDYRFSAMGTNNITAVDLDTTSVDDGAVAMNGVGLMLGGSLVQESVLIPASVGGIGDSWDNFDYFGITETGDYFFTGDSDGAAANDEFIVRNGTIWAREGDTIDGNIVGGALEGAYLNESGELAYIWDIDDGAGGTIEALFFESELLLKEGDDVDWDGDGAIDPGFTIDAFTGINSITMDADGAIYFTADIFVNGTLTEGYFVLGGNGAVGTNYCAANANSTGVPAVITAYGSDVALDNNLFLRSDSMPNNSFGLFVVSDTQAFVANPGGSEGNLCLGGAIGRFQTQIQNSGMSGSFEIQADLTSLPQPTSTVQVMAGQTWNFSAWFRDMSMTGNATSNFSDAVEVLFL